MTVHICTVNEFRTKGGSRQGGFPLSLAQGCDNIPFSSSGKCYNVVEETFLFNKDRARAEKSLPGQTRKKAAAEAAEAASGEHRNIPADFTQPRNIPAILPYEVKEALLRDMREDTTKPQKEEEGQSQVGPVLG